MSVSETPATMPTTAYPETVTPALAARDGREGEVERAEDADLAAVTRARNLLQLVRLRWMAIGGQVVTIVLVHWGLGIGLPLGPMLSLLLVLVLVNVFNSQRARGQSGIPDQEIFASILVDVAVLTAQLFLSGGGQNPFIHLYLLQVVVGTALLNLRYAWVLATVSGLCIALLNVWYRPLDYGTIASSTRAALAALGLLACYGVNVVLLLNFGARVAHNNRLRDERLARLRQQAAEAEHILRMGLLASGAAHELGTPLATMSVIVGDWQRMPAVAADPEMQEDLASLRQQLERCKKIVSGILLSVGQVRAESAEFQPLRTFIAERLEHWRVTRKPVDFIADIEAFADEPIAADSVLAQMFDNVLDNALEAAAGGPVRLAVQVAQDALKFCVRDGGPGFRAEILQSLGRPYQSTKTRPGSGLGLFLSINVARAYGGVIEARNLSQGGAEVVIRLPLKSLRPS